MPGPTDGCGPRDAALKGLSPPAVSGDSQRWKFHVMARPSKYPEELRERAVRVVGEVRVDYSVVGQGQAHHA